MHYRAVRAEIPVAFDYPSREINLREFVPRDAYPGICLGILEENVVFGLILFDEIILKQQSIRFRIDNRILGVSNL